jgi:hypothetical protein
VSHHHSFGYILVQYFGKEYMVVVYSRTTKITFSVRYRSSYFTRDKLSTVTLFDRYLIFFNIDENQWLLFDFIKGSFTGNILTPKSDVCLANSGTRVLIWKRSALITCRSSLSQVYMMFYNQLISPSSEDIMHFVNQSKTMTYNFESSIDYGFISQNDFFCAFPLSEAKWNVTIYRDVQNSLIPRSQSRVVRILARKQILKFIGNPKLDLRIAATRFGSVWEGFEAMCTTRNGLGDNVGGSARQVRVVIRFFGHKEGMRDQFVYLDKSGNIVHILAGNSYENRHDTYMSLKTVNIYSEMAITA